MLGGYNIGGPVFQLPFWKIDILIMYVLRLHHGLLVFSIFGMFPRVLVDVTDTDLFLLFCLLYFYVFPSGCCKSAWSYSIQCNGVLGFQTYRTLVFFYHLSLGTFKTYFQMYPGVCASNCTFKTKWLSDHWLKKW